MAMYVKKRKFELLRRMCMDKNRIVKKKIAAGMLVAAMACLSVATFNMKEMGDL